MFFPERVRSIKIGDRVLEVGPGGTPHPRSDVFLEKRFSENEAKAQRGHVPNIQTEKSIIYYDGGKFPFEDREFNYVICSHVLEHVPENDIPFFVQELHRVAPRGYVEFPTIYYEYIYNFPEHITILFYHDDELKYISKDKIKINQFRQINKFFYETLKAGYESFVVELKDYIFQGFEWEDSLIAKKAESIEEITLDLNRINISRGKKPTAKIRGLFHWLKK